MIDSDGFSIGPGSTQPPGWARDWPCIGRWLSGRVLRFSQVMEARGQPRGLFRRNRKKAKGSMNFIRGAFRQRERRACRWIADVSASRSISPWAF